jgi:hypothetical protein
MDLFWSGLAQRASEHTWNERRSQFSKVHEMVIQKIENEKQYKLMIDRHEIRYQESNTGRYKEH